MLQVLARVTRQEREIKYVKLERNKIIFIHRWHDTIYKKYKESKIIKANKHSQQSCRVKGQSKQKKIFYFYRPAINNPKCKVRKQSNL